MTALSKYCPIPNDGSCAMYSYVGAVAVAVSQRQLKQAETLSKLKIDWLRFTARLGGPSKGQARGPSIISIAHPWNNNTFTHSFFLLRTLLLRHSLPLPRSLSFPEPRSLIYTLPGLPRLRNTNPTTVNTQFTKASCILLTFASTFQTLLPRLLFSTFRTTTIGCIQVVQAERSILCQSRRSTGVCLAAYAFLQSWRGPLGEA